MLIALVAFGVTANAAGAQVAPAGALSREPSLFLDCQGITCDEDYVRTEVTFVRHVRERRDADVYVLVTMQPTADQGREVTLDFIGQNSFAGLDDRLRFASGPADSADAIRQKLVATLKRGLVRYLSRTALADDLTVVYMPTAATAAEPLHDRWNEWTFALSANGSMNSEELVSSSSVTVSAAANRVTTAWKVNAVALSQYSTSSFDIDGATVDAVQRSHGLTALVARGVNEHLSVGVRGSASSSTFVNQDLTVRAAPAVEFNVFPYSDATRRMFTFEYSIGATAYRYRETTIFGRTRETRADHQLLVALVLRQPWGSVGLSAEGSQFLQDWSKNSVILVGNADVSVARGLFLTTVVNLARIRDQLYLPARGASEQEILLRQRQLATSHSYSVSFGVSYTFGSPNARVVNRRFAGSVGGTTLTQ